MTAVTSDRMPPIPAGQMSDAQREVAQEIASGRRGAAGAGSGPFVPALRSPEFARRLQRLGEYLRYDMSLEPPLREMVILLTARAWTQNYEWHVHAPLAREAGLSAQTIEAIAHGQRPPSMSSHQALVYDAFVELQRTQTLSDATYGAAVGVFGEQGVIDLVGAIGYYSMLAMVMNVARTALPAGARPELTPLPR